MLILGIVKNGYSLETGQSKVHAERWKQIKTIFYKYTAEANLNSNHPESMLI